MSSAKLKFYQKEATKTRMADASPYQIIQMLMAGVMDNLALAKGAIQRKDYELKAASLSKASAIFESLRSCLDESVSPELGQNLYALYSYMIERLIDASVEKETTTAIDEVASLFREIKSAWDEIPLSAQQQAEAERSMAHANVG
ncbi:flagellar export chaperone FliS [Rheinheimera baltica]|uniref:Flagellar secretion chaperone FliS n=1 Tax=Rheinheimera baltica TaxID=67576 RepID=A0ABT9HUP5_9GAMM|nr:flagellar export chaperone FliS [Rheinheimera baltica]MDP5134852.1 flagellar export chaperone FliS [Rheinheimera baltica]MDP5143186.1 flagellar export chaperone FliS [Rheinheimera baltica]MDP5149897.1 flagellar export chaperone FliS [Rheinheimera baltica]